MVKSVDTGDLKSPGEIHPGSIPGDGTIHRNTDFSTWKSSELNNLVYSLLQKEHRYQRHIQWLETSKLSIARVEEHRSFHGRLSDIYIKQIKETFYTPNGIVIVVTP